MTRRVRGMQIALLSVMLLLVVVPVFAAPAEPESVSQISLTDLLVRRFGNLWQAEKRLVAATEIGDTADCTDLSGAEKIIRGDVLAWLCTNPQATAQVRCSGISIIGAQIMNELDIESAKVPFPLAAENCVFREGIDFSNSSINALDLANSTITKIQGNGAHIEGSIFLQKATVSDGVMLADAAIGGDVICVGANFAKSSELLALFLDRAKIEGAVFLSNGFQATGGVSLRDSKMRFLDCSNGYFVSNDTATPALAFDDAKIEGPVFFRGDHSRAEGGVTLINASIGGDFDCRNGQFAGSSSIIALTFDGVRIEGAVYLSDDFKATGGVSLRDAKMRLLDCNNGQFISKETATPALAFDDAKIEGPVFLRGDHFEAEGGVTLLNATISGNLECSDGKFAGAVRDAISAEFARISGSAFFRRVAVIGMVNFEAANVAGEFQWFNITTPGNLALNLQQAKVGTLQDEESWVGVQTLTLEDFVYDELTSEAFSNSEIQLHRLHLQHGDKFVSQPFEQLAGVLRKMGLEEDARKVMIAKNEEHARYVQGSPEWLWYGLFGQLIGYGYSPWRAFGISLAVILIGWAVFRRGYFRGLITPTGKTEYTMVDHEAKPSSTDYPKFNAFIYSLETFVPLINLGVGDRWEPNDHRDAYFIEKSWLMTGGCLRGYLWFHMIAGWVLSALWVGGITGLVKT